MRETPAHFKLNLDTRLNFFSTFRVIRLTYTSQVADLALIFFVFLIGLEIELSVLTKNIRTVPVVSVASWAACGAVSAMLTLTVTGDPNYSTAPFLVVTLVFTLLTATSALPVLARMLSERNMLHSHIGSLALAVSVCDDVIGWIMVAVVSAVGRATSHPAAAATDDPAAAGETTSNMSLLWTVLLLLAHFVIAGVVVRPILRYLARRTSARKMVTPSKFLGFCMVLIAMAYMTEAIGVSPLIGALEVGLLVPRDTPLASSLPVMLENIVSVLLMPLFFVLSGLRTNFLLIDDVVSLGLACLVIGAATATKMVGVYASARLCKVPWRSSLLLSSLLSTKGLVALIIANRAFDLGVITSRLFSIMSLMILVTTMGTAPLVAFLEPIRRMGLPEGVSPEQHDEAILRSLDASASTHADGEGDGAHGGSAAAAGTGVSNPPSPSSTDAPLPTTPIARAATAVQQSFARLAHLGGILGRDSEDDDEDADTGRPFARQISSSDGGAVRRRRRWSSSEAFVHASPLQRGNAHESPAAANLTAADRRSAPAAMPIGHRATASDVVLSRWARDSSFRSINTPSPLAGGGADGPNQNFTVDDEQVVRGESVRSTAAFMARLSDHEKPSDQPAVAHPNSAGPAPRHGVSGVWRAVTAIGGSLMTWMSGSTGTTSASAVTAQAGVGHPNPFRNTHAAAHTIGSNSDHASIAAPRRAPEVTSHAQLQHPRGGSTTALALESRPATPAEASSDTAMEHLVPEDTIAPFRPDPHIGISIEAVSTGTSSGNSTRAKAVQQMLHRPIAWTTSSAGLDQQAPALAEPGTAIAADKGVR